MKRTLFLWLVLIFAFLVIWQFLDSGGTSSTSHSGSDHVEPTEGAAWSPWVSVATPIVAITFFFGLILYRYGAAHRFNLSQEPGFLALAERRFDAAIEQLVNVAGQFRHKPLMLSVARINIAHAMMWAGRLDDALSECIRAERECGLVFSAGVRVLGAGELAILYALRGDTQTATKWVAETRRRLVKNGDDRMALAARPVVAELIIAAQDGEFLRANELFAQQHLVLRHSLTANLMRMVEIVGAYAASKANPEDRQAIRERLLRVLPTTGNEFAFLGAFWPGMRQFLEENALVC